MTRFLTRDPDTLFAEYVMQLFGAEFAGPLAEVLHVGRRTAERWARGSRGVPPFVWPIIIKLLEDKEAQLTAMRLTLIERCSREDYPQRDPIATEIDPDIEEHWRDHT